MKYARMIRCVTGLHFEIGESSGVYASSVSLPDATQMQLFGFAMHQGIPGPIRANGIRRA